MYSFKSQYFCLIDPPYITLLTNTPSTHNKTGIIPYAFPSKPSDGLFPCVHFAAYSYFASCRPLQ